LVTSVLRRDRPPASGGRTRPRVLIIIQNLAVPFDRRVWLECQSLRRAGYDVTVVCPAGDDSVPYTVLEGIEIYTYPGYAPGGRAVGFVAEYAYSFAATARLVLKARRRGGPFDVMQACNPPDIFWPLARTLRRRDGTRFVFDHHDLCPELYRSRFHNNTSPAYRGLVFLERMTFRTADRVTSTNESYAEIARRRGGKERSEVTVVRTGPDPEKLKSGSVDESLRKGRRHLVAYIGVMGPQDGVDLAGRAAGRVVHDLGRRDVSFVFMGSGDCHPDLVELRDELGLQDYLELPGRVPDEFVHRVLSTADLGLSPDPMNPLNDVSTMNKTMEYMAYGLPVVAFDLHETRVSAGPAAAYVEPNSIGEFARTVVDLLDQPDVRSKMGRLGRERVVNELAWEHQESGYVQVFDELTNALSERGR
jgi:glycosyltransferase involved in cell wall biosynthesis